MKDSKNNKIDSYIDPSLEIRCVISEKAKKLKISDRQF